MLGKPTQGQHQLSLFGSNLIQIINLNHPLVLLANQLPWRAIEEQFAPLYASVGNPSHPIRKMVALLLLQYLYKLSDERVVQEWEQNVYYQYFSGEASLQWGQPCAASDLVHFRKRIGQQGIEYLFKLSVALHGNKVGKAKELILDTTLQEKNITYPTDAKLYKKVIQRVNKEAKKLGVKLRQSYVRVVAKLCYLQRYARIAKQARKAKRALSKLRTISGRQVRELSRAVVKLGKQDVYAPLLSRMEAILSQSRESKDKIYSLHEESVSCIAKGKTGKRYEFGSKVSLAVLAGSGVIVGIQTYKGNPHDSRTLASTLEQVKGITGKVYSRILVDKGYKGASLGTGVEAELVLPLRQGLAKDSYRYYKWKRGCKRRSAIEARISHLKRDHKLGRNYLRGYIGDILNGLLSAIGYNLHLLLLELGKGIKRGVIFLILLIERKVKKIGVWFYTNQLNSSC